MIFGMCGGSRKYQRNTNQSETTKHHSQDPILPYKKKKKKLVLKIKSILFNTCTVYGRYCNIERKLVQVENLDSLTTIFVFIPIRS
jgi:hypothetical protein